MKIHNHDWQQPCPDDCPKAYPEKPTHGAGSGCPEEMCKRCEEIDN